MKIKEEILNLKSGGSKENLSTFRVSSLENADFLLLT
jgi:hypothetical protein